MKQITQSILDFILAFDLTNPLTGVCFDAMVFFYTDKLEIKIESEIHIISILTKKLDVLYILNPEISKKGFRICLTQRIVRSTSKKKKELLIKMLVG